MSVSEAPHARLLFGTRAYLAPLPPGGLSGYSQLLDFVHGTLGLAQAESPVTLKWQDAESDPCTVSSDLETAEALRLAPGGRLVLRVLPGRPERPGLLCPGETPALYRRGAVRKARETRVLMGHALRPAGPVANACAAAACDVCGAAGEGGGLLRCDRCRLRVHRRCCRLLGVPCRRESLAGRGAVDPDSQLPGSSAEVTATTAEDPVVGRAKQEDKPNAVPETETATVEESLIEATSQNPAPEHRHLSAFTLLKVVGRGSYGKVLQVEHRETKRHYAMKVVRKDAIKSDDDADLVHTEKSVFEQASNHPFLVGLHSCFQTDTRLFFVIEFVSGGDLMYHMQRNHRLTEPAARFYAAEVSCALHFLHERGIIYRDLKLDNVLLDAEGHVKLTDFGMCKENVSESNLARTFCGTPNYIAPEVISRAPYGLSVDFWALGVMLFEMLAGRSPWRLGPDSTQDDLFRLIVSSSVQAPRGLSRPAAAALSGLLQRRPEQRLGGTRPGDFAASLARHPFFRRVGPWTALEQRLLQPPFRPATGATAFDEAFTREPPQLTVDERSAVASRVINQSEFDGFEYVNPLLMSKADPV